MTNEQRRTFLHNNIKALHEEIELEHLVSVVGSPEAQAAADRHRLPEFVASVQDRGTDYRHVA
jgi:hypothetical protein